MKLGFQTILYGSHIDDLKEMLQTVAGAGFQGVEFFQHPHNIRLRRGNGGACERVNVADLAGCLKECGLVHGHPLTFLGLTGGTLADRIAFCEAADSQKMAAYGLTIEDCWPEYFYVECEEDARLPEAAHPRVKIAVHPHVFKKLDSLTAACEKLTDIANNFYWVPDTAHMFIQGENPVVDICKLPKDRVIAVHIKDWDAAYGRASHRYAKGFTLLGAGDVPLRETLNALRQWGFDKWLVYEQDYPNITRAGCIRRAAEWFSKNGFPMNEKVELPDKEDSPTDRLKGLDPKVQALYRNFVKTLYQAGSGTLPDCYGRVARAIRNLFSACQVAFWSYNVTRPEMCLLAEATAFPILAKRALRLDRRYSRLGRNAETMQPEIISFAGEAGEAERKKLRWSEAIAEMQAKSMVTIPIPNLYNPNQVRFVVGILLQEEPPSYWEELCWLLADDVARSIDTALDDACAYVTERVNFLADRADDLKEFSQNLHDLIQKQLDCESVALFLATRDQERLEPWRTPKTRWRKSLPFDERYYLPSETKHPTCQCWQEGRVVLLADPELLQQGNGPLDFKSSEVPHASLLEQDSLLLTPILTLNAPSSEQQEFTCVGVARCRNKKALESPSGAELVYRYFTDDDAALCSAACAAAVPHIEIWLNKIWQHETFALMVHELHFPLNMTLHALEQLEIELSELTPNPLNQLRNPTHKRIGSWITLMQRVVGSADALGFEYDYLEPDVQHISMLGEVLAPAVAQVRQIAKRRDFDPARIRYEGFETLPRLWLDPNLFQQVFFNLFSNSLKYAFDSPEMFRIDLHAERRREWFCITFADYGPGIGEEFRETIFERGRRGPKHTSDLVPGLGFGLWIVRSIIEKHGGSVTVTQTYDPMEFTIKLPTYLERRPPKF